MCSRITTTDERVRGFFACSLAQAAVMADADDAAAREAAIEQCKNAA